MTDQAPQEKNFRLNVNINHATKAAIEGWTEYDNVTITETVRRAIGVYTCIRTAITEGRELILHDPESGQNTLLVSGFDLEE